MQRNVCIILAVAALAACSKQQEPSSPCAAISIITNVSAAQPCNTEGRISIAAPLGNDWRYQLQNGTFTSDTVFRQLLPGTYRITARNAEGCTGVAQVTIPEPAPGPLFAAVKTLLAANCLQCHSGPNPQAGHDFSRSCDILTQWERIKARAVDGNPSPMPQAGLLPLNDRNKISAWINAGHQFNQ